MGDGFKNLFQDTVGRQFFNSTRDEGVLAEGLVQLRCRTSDLCVRKAQPCLDVGPAHVDYPTFILERSATSFGLHMPV